MAWRGYEDISVFRGLSEGKMVHDPIRGEPDKFDEIFPDQPPAPVPEEDKDERR